MRVLLPGAQFGTTYCHIALEPVGGELSLSDPFVLYASAVPTTLPAEGDPSVVRTVVFEGGLELDVTPDAIGFGGSYDDLAARRVDVAGDPPCFARGAFGLVDLWVLEPEVAIRSPGFPFRIPNATGLAPGTPVDLLLLGGLDTELADGTAVEEADFVVFATGTVRADGSRIDPDGAAGLPYLSWLGVRAIE
jgi:hypothetical protein